MKFEFYLSTLSLDCCWIQINNGTIRYTVKFGRKLIWFHFLSYIRHGYDDCKHLKVNEILNLTFHLKLPVFCFQSNLIINLFHNYTEGRTEFGVNWRTVSSYYLFSRLHGIGIGTIIYPKVSSQLVQDPLK